MAAAIPGPPSRRGYRSAKPPRARPDVVKGDHTEESGYARHATLAGAEGYCGARGNDCARSASSTLRRLASTPGDISVIGHDDRVARSRHRPPTVAHEQTGPAGCGGRRRPADATRARGRATSNSLRAW
jgi:hypothetical protein